MEDFNDRLILNVYLLLKLQILIVGKKTFTKGTSNPAPIIDLLS